MAPYVTRLVFRMFRGALVGLDVSEVLELGRRRSPGVRGLYKGFLGCWGLGFRV